MFKKMLIAICLVGFVLSACSSSTGSIKNTQWNLATLNNQAVLADPKVTMKLEDDKISGSDGCNSYGGSFSTSGSKFSVGKDIVSTEMACSEPIMQQSSTFYAILTHSAAYKIEDQQLTLLDAKGVPLATFTAQSK
jgi:heat shock protein HslJ